MQILPVKRAACFTVLSVHYDMLTAELLINMSVIRWVQMGETLLSHKNNTSTDGPKVVTTKYLDHLSSFVERLKVASKQLFLLLKRQNKVTAGRYD